MSKISRMAATGLIVILGAGLAVAAGFEKPPSYNAASVLGAAQGPGYTVANPVQSDGYLRNYKLNTPWGTVSASGDQMVFLRIKELAALEAMERTTDSRSFKDAVVKAGLSPVEFAGKLISSPVSTVENTVSGVGKLFGGIASGIRNRGKTQDSVVDSVTGESKQRRLIAYQYGIDPYTDFPPLKAKLDDLSKAAAAGGLLVTAAFIAIPGAAGTVISNVSTADTLNTMVRDSSAAELMDFNRKKLLKIGVRKDLAEQLLTHDSYTPVDVTAIADSLTRMGPMKDVNVMITRAISADSRDVAYFIRRRIEMTASYQQTSRELTGFRQFDGTPFPFSTTTGNGIVGVFPIDSLCWTNSTSKAITTTTAAARAYGITGPMTFYISGTATPLAKRQLSVLGWTVIENGG